MTRLLKERKEVVLEKYLELCLFESGDARCAWLVGDEGNLSEKTPRFERRDFLSSTRDFYFSRIDIVRATIGSITFFDNDFIWFSVLSLTHEEKKCYHLLGESVEDIEIFDIFCHKKS